MTGIDTVKRYLDQGYRCVFWPAIGDTKGPREDGWTRKQYVLADYHEGYRVGLLTGVETSPGRFLHDVDIDWAPGSSIAQAMLPATGFVFGRPSKRVSHCFYTLPEALPSYRYEDVDKTCLIELRGTKANGDLGMQTMAPPSIWSKDNKKEPLEFKSAQPPAHLENANALKQRVCLSAIGMLLAKHLGRNGFGHDPRLVVAGFLLRAGVPLEDGIKLGEAMCPYTNNLEVADVRRAFESTAQRLLDPKQKVKGGPALAKLIGGSVGKQVINRINEWLGRDSDFVRVEGVIVKDNQQNIKRAIEMLGHELSYNSFSDKMLVDGVPIEDREMTSMWLRIDEEYKFRPTYMFFEKVVHKTAWENAFHPVKQYLDALTWDGTPRLDDWLTTCAGVEPNDYVRAVSSIVLIAAVRRIRKPGCKFDELLVLEGDQGFNKSSAIRALCPKGAWFSDDLPLNLKSQQMIEATLGKWIIEAADLAGKRKAEIEQLKANLSRQVDGPARMAYAHLPVERPRQFVIIGTTNSAAYLTDPTGARRFWPIEIKRFDVAKVLEMRDQLWAEAAHREAAGESIRLKEELWPEAAVHQERRREIDTWEAPLRKFLLTQQRSTDDKLRVTTNSLWEALSIPLERRDRSGSLRITEIMQRFGFKRTRVRPQGEEVQVGFVGGDASKIELEEGDAIENGVRIDDEPPF